MGIGPDLTTAMTVVRGVFCVSGDKENNMTHPLDKYGITGDTLDAMKFPEITKEYGRVYFDEMDKIGPNVYAGAIYSYFAAYSDHDGHLQVRLSTIATEVGMSRGTARKAIKHLQAVGVVRVNEGWCPWTGARDANIYSVRP